MYTEEYKKLHELYIAGILEYHNAHMKYATGRQSREDTIRIRKAIKNLKDLNTQMLKEISVITLAKRKAALDAGHFQWQRTLGKENGKYINRNKKTI
jgi:hypothetical protein